MRIFILISLVLLLISCHSNKVISTDMHEKQYDLLTTIGEHYKYMNGNANLIRDIITVRKNNLQNISTISFFSLYKNGLILIGNERTGDQINMNRLSVYYIENNQQPEKIMEIDTFVHSLFYLIDDYLFVYYRRELTLVDIGEKSVLWVKNLDINNLKIIFILKTCVLI